MGTPSMRFFSRPSVVTTGPFDRLRVNGTDSFRMTLWFYSERLFLLLGSCFFSCSLGFLDVLATLATHLNLLSSFSYCIGNMLYCEYIPILCVISFAILSRVT
jgi:hypothetical protein